jgi:RNA:NAD 2'-phosphotransferase (TPT1/KptA family)
MSDEKKFVRVSKKMSNALRHNLDKRIDEKTGRVLITDLAKIIGELIEDVYAAIERDAVKGLDQKNRFRREGDRVFATNGSSRRQADGTVIVSEAQLYELLDQENSLPLPLHRTTQEALVKIRETGCLMPTGRAGKPARDVQFATKNGQARELPIEITIKRGGLDAAIQAGELTAVLTFNQVLELRGKLMLTHVDIKIVGL